MQRKEAPYTVCVEELVVHVTPKRMTHIRLHIRRADACPVMSVPYGLPRARAEVFVKERAAWIRSHIEKVKARPENTAHLCENGDKIRIFSDEVTVVFLRGRRGWERAGDTLLVGVTRDADGVACDKRLQKVLQEMLEREISRELPPLAARIGVSPAGWHTRRMTSRWGSCSGRTRSISVNTSILHYPHACLTYVLVHELCHLKVMAHNNAFWSLVELHCPDYREAAKLLRGR